VIVSNLVISLGVSTVKNLFRNALVQYSRAVVSGYTLWLQEKHISKNPFIEEE